MIKNIKSVLWRVAKRLSYIEDARCLKVKRTELSLSVNGELKNMANVNSIKTSSRIPLGLQTKNNSGAWKTSNKPLILLLRLQKANLLP